MFCRSGETVGTSELAFRVPRWVGVMSLVAFFALLALLPLVASSGLPGTSLFDAFYRSGALVFGGGHVVLPLLQAEVVDPGWVSVDAFLAGYGITQAMPGPLFTFAAYLGAVVGPEPNGLAGAGIALVAVFLSGCLVHCHSGRLPSIVRFGRVQSCGPTTLLWPRPGSCCSPFGKRHPGPLSSR
jgi:chromate transporter